MKNLGIVLIKIYKKNISPVLAAKGYNCKFYPTCSEYTAQAIEKYGTVRGSIIGIKRIMRCNPISKGGYDPLK